jgi:hypothetical protein
VPVATVEAAATKVKRRVPQARGTVITTAYDDSGFGLVGRKQRSRRRDRPSRAWSCSGGSRYPGRVCVPDGNRTGLLLRQAVYGSVRSAMSKRPDADERDDAALLRRAAGGDEGARPISQPWGHQPSGVCAWLTCVTKLGRRRWWITGSIVVGHSQTRQAYRLLEGYRSRPCPHIAAAHTGVATAPPIEAQPMAPQWLCPTG